MTTINRQAGARLEGGLSVLGVSLVALGGLLLLDRLGLEVAGIGVGAFWPVVPLALGVRWLWRRQVLAGALFTIGGGLLLAATTGALRADPAAVVFPLVLVLIGIVLLFGNAKARSFPPPIDTGDASVALLSSRKWSAAAVDLDGRTLVSVLGDVDVTVTAGEPSLEPITVSTVTLLGDTDIVVPEGWKVTSGVVALLGDLTLPPEQSLDPSAPVLHLSGVVVLGDCTVRRA